MQINLGIDGPTLTLPQYWQPFRTVPDDPPDTQAFGYKFTDGAMGAVTAHAILPQHEMPLDRQALIDGLQETPGVIAGEAGLIEVNVDRTASEIPYVYSLMKIRQEPHGVQYNLTLHLLGYHQLQVQGNFAEADTTGMREAVVYEMAQRQGLLAEPTADDPTGGWARDPYSGSRTGLVMNMSELPGFDSQFPGHPLAMARELLTIVLAS